MLIIIDMDHCLMDYKPFIFMAEPISERCLTKIKFVKALL